MTFQSIILGHIIKHEIVLMDHVPESYDWDFFVTNVKNNILIVSADDYKKYKNYFESITFIVYDNEQVENVPTFDTLQSCLNYAVHVHPEKKIYTLENSNYIEQDSTCYEHPACSDVYIIHLSDPFPNTVTDPFHPEHVIPGENLMNNNTFVTIPDAYQWTFEKILKKNNQVQIISFKRVSNRYI